MIKRIIYAMIGGMMLLAGCDTEPKYDVLETTMQTGTEEKKTAASEENLAMKDCTDVMENIWDIYEQCEKDENQRRIITDSIEEAMIQRIGDMGYFVSSISDYKTICNYEKMDTFLKNAQKGKSGECIYYEVHSDGGVGRYQFIFDGKEMHSLYIKAAWNAKTGKVNMNSSYDKIKRWKYTKKGWFEYELVVPTVPEVSEVINANALIRVKPLNKDCLEMTVKYVKPLGYQGNNLLCSNWDSEHLDQIDYNGLYEYLYYMKTGKQVQENQYENGIPKKEFEKLLTTYLPVTNEQLEQYAVFDTKTQTYAWERLGCLNYSPNEFGTSIPEVTNVIKQEDGTYLLQIDVVCEMAGSDCVMSHELIIAIENGTVRYLKNRVLENGLEKIPRYQYRMEKK